jgi:hypothetical protein
MQRDVFLDALLGAPDEQYLDTNSDCRSFSIARAFSHDRHTRTLQQRRMVQIAAA